MFQVGVFAPRSAVAIANVHSRRFNRNSGAGWNSGVDRSQPGFVQRETCPGFQNNAFVEHTIQDTNQVIRIGNKGAHCTNIGCPLEVQGRYFFADCAKPLDTFFISFNCHRATVAERLLDSCPGTAQHNAPVMVSLSADEPGRSLFPAALPLPPSSMS